MTEGPDFSRLAETYATARPTYPPGLFAWLAGQAPGRALAWDTATGNGQAALGLAEHFEKVVATDHSEAQIRHARAHPRVEYRVGPAESSDLPPSSVDLVTAAAAMHWFDLPRFYAEVARVLRPGGVVAAWSYHVAHIDPPFDQVLWPFYQDVVGPYFSAGARLVDNRYEEIALPGSSLDPPAFVIQARWTAAQMVGFIRTWSGVQAYIDATGNDPVAPLVPRLSALWGTPDATLDIRWPLYLRASRM